MPGRAIVRLQKQVIRYQGRHMSDVRVCEDRTLALWKADGREGTAVKGPSVSAGGSDVRQAQEKEILTVAGQGSCDRDL